MARVSLGSSFHVIRHDQYVVEGFRYGFDIYFMRCERYGQRGRQNDVWQSFSYVIGHGCEGGRFFRSIRKFPIYVDFVVAVFRHELSQLCNEGLPHGRIFRYSLESIGMLPASNG